MSLAPVVLSLCDFTGAWSQPYADAGYLVHRVDLKHGRDVRLLPYAGPVRGILAAPYTVNLERVSDRDFSVAEGRGSMLDCDLAIFTKV